MATQKSGTNTGKKKTTTESAKRPAAKKSTGTGASTSKKTGKTYRAKKGHRTTANAKVSPQKRQRVALILFVSALCLLFVTVIPGESLWRFLHNLLLGAFGPIAYLWPVLLLYIALSIAFEKSIRHVRSKLYLSTAFVCICSVLYFLFGGFMADEGFFRQLGRLFTEGYSKGGPGLISGLIGIPFAKLLGMTGAKIFAVLMAFLVLMLLTGTGLAQLIHWITTPAKVVKDKTVVLIEDAAAAARQSRSRESIDIPLHDEDEAFRADEQRRHDESFQRLMDGSTGKPARESSRKKKALPAPDPEPIVELPPISSGSTSADFPEEPEWVSEPEVPDEDMSDILDTIRQLENPEPVHKSEPKNEKSEKTEQPGKPAPASDTPAPSTDAEPLEPMPVPVQQYHFPPVTLLEEDKVAASTADNTAALQATGERLITTLKSFGVSASILNISKGPTVTRYELQPAAGVKISRITNLADDIALNLAAGGVRIEAPIPNKAAIGIEVPNRKTSIVRLRGLVESSAFNEASSRLTVALGKDIAGNITLTDLAKMPHLLIAGSTGSGKSVCINTMIVSLLYKSTPDEVRFLMIDPKVVELGVYNGIPHLLVPVVTDPRKAAGALNWAVGEMLSRYKTFAATGVRDLSSYNHYVEQKKTEDPTSDLKPMPQIVIIVDELADLMMAAPNEVEDAICRLAQMARAAGMHLVIATQRPSVDVITGVIKANVPSRIAFAVSSQVDSRTILDASGAEKLLGRGDMLFAPIGSNKPTRVQGCFVSESEIEQIVDFIKQSAACEYDPNVANEIERRAVPEKNGHDGEESNPEDDTDPMLDEAVRCVSEAGQASTSLLQRKLRLGYARAGRLIDEMENRGIVGPHEGSKPRQVLMSYAQWMDRKQPKEPVPEEIL